ncbi:MAG: CBS domain-containing protein [Planctomycetia bacterium]|nr:CBS domain-containing protein [Planctomycetia bacterium]
MTAADNNPLAHKTTVAELSGVVGDIMCKKCVTVLPNVSAADTAEQIAASGDRHAVVVDSDRRIMGVVSQRDIFTHFMETLQDQRAAQPAATGQAPWEIGSLIHDQPVTVLPDVLLCNAGLVMANYKIDCLPVVDENKLLLGIVSIKELLRHITGKLDAGLEEEFTFFTPEKKSRPQIPAFFRRANGALVLPSSCLEDPTSVPEFAVLGYEAATGRIAVRLTSDKNEEGGRKVQKDNDSLVIAASDFVARFDIKLHVSAFDVTRHRKLNCVILTPKQSLPTHVAAEKIVAVV